MFGTRVTVSGLSIRVNEDENLAPLQAAYPKAVADPWEDTGGNVTCAQAMAYLGAAIPCAQPWWVQAWHDTAMWNEGFQYANGAWISVPVASEADAQAVVAALGDTYASSNRSRSQKEQWGNSFLYRIVALIGSPPIAVDTVTAETTLRAGMDSWGGL